MKRGPCPGVSTTSYRIGLGEDRHRLSDGGPLRLGGVDIPHTQQLVGHSDADALLHAVTDAILGAAGLPDIGELFPNTDEANEGRDSSEILQIAFEMVESAGWNVVNIDCVVSTEAPKISPHKDAIRHHIAMLLNKDSTAVGLKAKTGEGVGPVGRGEVLDARCVALLSGTPGEC